MDELIKKLQNAVTSELILPKFRNPLFTDGKQHPLTGSCYIVSEALYHLIAKDLGYRPARITLPDGLSHWFLSKGNDIIDPTSSQFPFPLDYSGMKLAGFMTSLPSKRARILMERVK